MTQPMFEEPEELSGIRINPADVLGHRLMVWAVEYIEHSPTRFTTPDKKSDVIVVDIVDLDLDDPETNQSGYLARRQWWRQGRLIQTLRGKIGRPLPMLVVMSKGVGTQGFAAPYELVSQSGDPEAVELANQWLKAHPDFAPSTPRDQRAPVQQSAPNMAATTTANRPSTEKRWEQNPPTPHTPAQTESLMDRLKRDAERKRQGQLPPPPESQGPPPF